MINNITIFAETTSLGIIKFIFIVSAYLLPYILIPFMIKSLSGVFGNLAGMVNDRSKGLLDRNAKFRQGKRAEKMAAAKNFQRFNGNGIMARSANTMGGVLRNKPTNTYSKGQRASLRQSGLAVQGEADLKNDRVWQANQNDDKFHLALANRELAIQKMNEHPIGSETRAGYQRALDAASQVGSSGKTSTKYAAAMALAKSGYQFSDGEEGYNELRQTMAQFSGGDTGVLGSMMNEAQFHLKNAGRIDQAGINDGGGYAFEKGLEKVSDYQLGATVKPETYNAAAVEYFGKSVKYSQADVDSGLINDASLIGKVKSGQHLNDHVLQGLRSGDISQAKAEKWHRRLVGAGQGATGKNADLIRDQRQAIESAAQALATPTSVFAAGPAGAAQNNTQQVNGPGSGLASMNQQIIANKAEARGFDPNDPRIQP
jgi:hypothetical protein